MAIRDSVSYQDLSRYLGEVHDLFVDFLETCYPDAIEDFLYQHGDLFAEWMESEGLGGEND